MANVVHNCGVYEIVAPSGNHYIGSSHDLSRRWIVHRNKLKRGTHHNRPLQSAWRKYDGNLVFRPLLICATSDLLMYEQLLIDALKPSYNIAPTAGSALGIKRTEEFKQKVSRAHMGIKPSAETLAKITEANRKRTASPEWREKMRIITTGKKRSPESIEKGRQKMIGHYVSPETAKKISLAKMGKPLSPEHIAKLVKANTGRKLSPEHCAKLSAIRTGKKRSPEACAAISAGKKASWARKKAAQNAQR